MKGANGVIKLSVEPYCNTCDKFSPISETYRLCGDGVSEHVARTYTETIVKCEHAELCRNLSAYISNELKKGG